MSHSVFRAIETRVPLVRVGNSGITCLVEADGRVRDATVNSWRQPPRATVVTWRVGIPGPEWTPTLYMRYGDRLFALPCGAMAGIGFVLALAAARRKIPAA
jgi:apolipoprotein N-acyltransferase